MTVKKILDNIIEWRERKKQYSQAYIGQRMGMTQKAYSKIETGETKLTVHHLIQICDILEVELSEILEPETAAIYNNHANHHGDGNVMTKYMDTDSKGLYEKLIASKDKEIEILRKYIDRLGEVE
jgi:transcriptional regulator with XRE-family HTH domain